MTKVELLSDIEELLIAIEIIGREDYPPNLDDISYLLEKASAIRVRVDKEKQIIDEPYMGQVREAPLMDFSPDPTKL